MQSQWKPRSKSVSLDTTPEPFTRAEITWLVSHVDSWPIRSPFRRVRESYKDFLKMHLSEQLLRCTLITGPNRQKAMEKLIGQMEAKYRAALAHEGDPVGLLAATSIASVQTQASMKTFSSASGSQALVEQGINALITIVYTRLARNDLKMITHFNRLVTSEEVIAMRASLIQVMVSELVQTYTVGHYVNNNGEISIEWWHQIHNDDPNSNFTLSKGWVLRLYLDMNKCYYHRITPEQVAKAIEAQNGTGDVSTAYSPFKTGIVDLVVNHDENAITFLSQALYKNLSTIQVKGAKGINNITPYHYDLNDLIASMTTNDEGNTVVAVGKHNMNVAGSIFPAFHFLKRHIEKQGYRVLQTNRTYGMITDYVVEGVMSKLPEQKYVYMVANGANIDEILALPIVDPLRTTTNDLFIIHRQIGVEAARAYFLYELLIILGANGEEKNINWGHISLLVSLVFVRGRPAGTTNSGNIFRGQEALTLASAENGAKAFIAAALNQAFEPVENTSVAVVTGELLTVGPRAEFLNPKPETIQREEAKLEAKEEFKRLINRETVGNIVMFRAFNNRIQNAVATSINPTTEMITPPTAEVPTTPTAVQVATPSTNNLLLQTMPSSFFDATKPAPYNLNFIPIPMISTTDVSSPIVQLVESLPTLADYSPLLIELRRPRNITNRPADLPIFADLVDPAAQQATILYRNSILTVSDIQTGTVLGGNIYSNAPVKQKKVSQLTLIPTPAEPTFVTPAGLMNFAGFNNPVIAQWVQYYCNVVPFGRTYA
jgi:hypothetical protein